MAKDKLRTKSKYALKLGKRKRLSGGRTHSTMNQGQVKQLPLPLPLLNVWHKG